MLLSRYLPPQPPERADILVPESIYGARFHEDSQTRRQRLEAVIEQALQDQRSHRQTSGPDCPPSIVIAGEGMCGGGRIVNCLKTMLGDKWHNVLFGLLSG